LTTELTSPDIQKEFVQAACIKRDTATVPWITLYIYIFSRMGVFVHSRIQIVRSPFTCHQNCQEALNSSHLLCIILDTSGMNQRVSTWERVPNS
jgi:hypothetical protein